MWKVIFGIMIGVVAFLGYQRGILERPRLASWHLACFEASHVLPGCTGLSGPAYHPPEIIKVVEPTNKKPEPHPAYCAYKAIHPDPTCPRIQWIRAHQRREAILLPTGQQISKKQ